MGVVLPAKSGARSEGGRPPEARLDEGVGLTRSIGLDVVYREIVPLRRMRPATLFGTGALEAIAAARTECDLEVIIVDGDLSPVQQRNLEKAWGCKVIDRTALILEIFGARARTREGSLQVELASLTYQLSRLVRSWTHLERQRGGFGFLGGPGETQIETDRRLIRERIAQLKKDLAQVARTRGLHRKARQRVPFPVVALVGYTNAGKSTLFNRLTGAAVDARDQLFATLDPTLRAVDLPSGERIILSDTVGFISDLPTALVAAFRATLEEVVAADLIVHVRDISHPNSEEQKRDVETVLRELGLEETVADGLIEVLNKIDNLDGEARLRLVGEAARHPERVPLSALTGEGVERLLGLIAERLGGRRLIEVFALDSENGAALAWLYAHGRVLERSEGEGEIRVRVALGAKERGQFLARFAAAARSLARAPRPQRQRA